MRERFIFLLSLLCCVVSCYVHQEVGLWGKARGIIANIKNLINPSILFVGKAFAENSSSTSLQRVAGRRVVSLSSGYFQQKAFPTTILDRKDSAQPHGV